MAEKVVREWLAEYKVLSPVQVHSFARTYRYHDELIQGIVNVLEDRPRQHELLEPVCNQLFTFYRAVDLELHRTALQFLPALIGTYLITLNRAIESLLVSIYNWEVVDQNGKPKKQTFRLPNLTQPSIYHEMMNMSSTLLTENALLRLDKGDPMTVTIGPFSQIEAITAQNRMRVMTVLMKTYNNHLSYMSKTSLHSVCKISTRLVKQGFIKGIGLHQRAQSFGSKDVIAGLSSASIQPRPNPRIPLSPQFLMEILHAVYFSMFNGLTQYAMQSLDDIHDRATHELFADVLLVTNAIQSSLKLSPAGQPTDGPMGISIALSPTTNTSTLSKSIITNASFRTKKLPDDIPIQPAGETQGIAQQDVMPLTVISEESENSANNDKSHSSVKVKSSMASIISRKVDKNKATRKEAGAFSLPNNISSSSSSLNMALPSSGTKSVKDLVSTGKGEEKHKKEKDGESISISISTSVSSTVGAGAGAAAASIKKLFLTKPQIMLGYKQQNGEASSPGIESMGVFRFHPKGVLQSDGTELSKFPYSKKDNDHESKALSPSTEYIASVNAACSRQSSNATVNASIISNDSMGFDASAVAISGSSSKVNSSVHTAV